MLTGASLVLNLVGVVGDPEASQASQQEEPAAVESRPSGGDKTPAPSDQPSPQPEPVKDTSPAAAAYRTVAAEASRVGPQDLIGVYRSVLDPSWASVRLAAPQRDGSYLVFVRKQDGGWKAEKSVLADEPEHPESTAAVLSGVPEDLVKAIYPPVEVPLPAPAPEQRAVQFLEENTGITGSWKPGEVRTAGERARVAVDNPEEPEKSTVVYLAQSMAGGPWYVVAAGKGLTAAEVPDFPEELVEPGSLPDVVPAQVPPPEPVLDGVPKKEREEVEKALDEARKVIDRYGAEHGGVAGFYVRDVEKDYGYGIRPDETFFSASVIKVPVMVAVYRKIEAGELSYGDRFATTEEDWAAGAGGLQWEPAGTEQTVEDYLWLMMTQSDNVATNVLVRLVGGPGYVNEVAASMGAENTVLYQKVSSKRAAVPSLDNRTTPRDITTMLEEMQSGKAVKDAGYGEDMIGLMRQNELEYWAEGGLPPEVEMANKGGWIDGVFNDTGIVEYDEGPYTIAILTKYGPEEVAYGQPVLTEISRLVWEAQKEPDENPPED